MEFKTRKASNTKADASDQVILCHVSEAVISCLFYEPEQIENLIAIGLTPEHFIQIEYRTIFETMLSLFTEHKYFTPHEVISKLPDYAGLIKKIYSQRHLAGWNYFYQILNRAKIKDILQLQLMSLSNFVNSHSLDDDIDIIEKFKDIEQALKVADTSRDLTDGYKEGQNYLDELIASRFKGELGFDTGLKEINADLNGGIQRKQLTVIGARPGCGKTTLALQVALRSALGGASVLFISVEMDSADMVTNGLSFLSKINNRSIRNGVVPGFELPRLQKAKEIFNSLKIRFCLESDYQKIMQVIHKSLKLYAVDIVVIDYLQNIVNIDKNLQKREQMNILTASLKRLATEKNIAVIGCAQLNRGVEGRAEQRPRLSDLKESGSIEQDADVVMFIHRHSDGERSAVTLHLAKNRRGRTGTIECFANYAINTICKTDTDENPRLSLV